VVTDINDNSNKKVPVTFTVSGGNGSVTPSQGLTDDSGVALSVYTAGKTAGTVLVEARHTSRAPTQEELRRVYGTLFVPRFMPDQEREQVEVLEWLVASGDKVLRGQPLARIGTRSTEKTLSAPEEGIFVREVRHKRDRVALGETVGYLEIAPDVWAAKYVK
jgi:multidrug efflux pump subunit AcrA (membrane-fusion protein)